MDIITLFNCTEIMDGRVFHGSLRGKHFLVLILNGRTVDGFDDKPAFATSDECPELADADGPIVVWWKGACRGSFRRSAPWYRDDGGLYRYPLKKVAELR